jgi:hypothetical protein
MQDIREEEVVVVAAAAVFLGARCEKLALQQSSFFRSRGSGHDTNTL